ncbi:MAG TPA: hypothetical protein VIA18_11190 [Polyangia bacterium]|nr:hypothetical protein [Polyangia bacterium]
MNRIMTALALSGLFIAAPAFAKSTPAKPVVAGAGDKAAAGDTAKTDAATPAADATAKPAKKAKKSKKTPKTDAAAPSEAPAK